MLNYAFINLGTLRENALSVKAILDGKEYAGYGSFMCGRYPAVKNGPVYNKEFGKETKRVKFCAVVKADAYGHGAPECAAALYDIADCFAVAITEEGICLRQSGIDKEILVLTAPFKNDLERAVYYGLTLTVCSFGQFFAISEEAHRQKRKVSVHIKVDTGMNRQGVKSVEVLKKIMEASAADDLVKVSGIYSHFAKPEDNDSRKSAHDKFLLAIRTVKGYNNKITAHISASGGFLAGEYFDMVRIGILLYGYKPYKTDIIDVKPVMSVYAPVLDTRIWKAGEKALYGDIPVTKSGEYALIRYGYADGLPRKNIVGQHNNRCMDITAVSAAESRFTENGWCRVLGDADKLAESYSTISYEILSKAAIRAEKIYIR